MNGSLQRWMNHIRFFWKYWRLRVDIKIKGSVGSSEIDLAVELPKSDSDFIENLAGISWLLFEKLRKEEA